MNRTTSPAIKTVGLFGRYGDTAVGGVIRGLCDFLRARKLDIVLEDATAALADKPDMRRSPIAEIGRHIDLGIVIGGDGTLLNVARNLAANDVPLVGVNVGRLGFLADISTNDMLDVISTILDGDFQTEERFLLNAEIVRNGEVIHTFNPFNDVVLNKGGLARLIEFDIYIDGDFVSGFRADGIIVATPTGSTAYALSAGGPILHPSVQAIVLVPICPHTLSNRPLAVNSSSEIDIVLTDEQSVHVTFDGQSTYTIRNGDRVRVRRGDMPVKLLHPTNRNYYEVLRMKLHWGKKL